MSYQADNFYVVGIPLSRPQIGEFLLPPKQKPQGVPLRIIGQRPTESAERQWLNDLAKLPNPTIDDFLTIDNPQNNLTNTYTDRLVPVEFLVGNKVPEPHFLTRDLGGWVANYFGVVGLPTDWPDDPLLNHAEVLTEYGRTIQFTGADSNQVQERLQDEVGMTLTELQAIMLRLGELKQKMLGESPSALKRCNFITYLYNEIATGKGTSNNNHAPVPVCLLLDEMMAQLVRLELERRTAVADGDNLLADSIYLWQSTQETQSGLRLMLKGEYIVGRHRRSTVLIAPELGYVVKQPGHEPFHEIGLGYKTAMGRPENWPYLTKDGSVVTARGRLRLIVEENVVPPLSQTFNYGMKFCTLLGLTIEPFIAGDTVQDTVLGNHARLNQELYETIVLHQQVCEALGVENGDWHAPNFIIRPTDQAIVHIDWGAARPLRSEELNAEGYLSRLNQVSNMAFSFRDPKLAAQLKQLHHDLIHHKARMDCLRQQALEMARPYGGTLPDDYGVLDQLDDR